MALFPVRRAGGPCGLLAILALAGVVGRPAPAFPDDEGVSWRADFDKARSEARKTGKPLFVVFR